MSEEFTFPVVSMIVERRTGELGILLQVRSKESAGPFRGLLELPQGKMRRGESLVDCARRELEEETGLTCFEPTPQIGVSHIKGESLEHSSVIVVSETGYHSFLAICLVGSASGTPHESAESAEPRWYRIEEVSDLLTEGRIFPLNVPMLERYLASK